MQVGHLVFLKTSMSKKCSILKMSALGLLAHSVRVLSFRTDFTIHDIAISIIHQPSVLFQSRLETFLSVGTGRSCFCCRLCQMCPTSCHETWMTHPVGSWKLNDPPLTKGTKTDDPPPSCSGPPCAPPFTSANTFWPVPYPKDSIGNTLGMPHNISSSQRKVPVD